MLQTSLIMISSGEYKTMEKVSFKEFTKLIADNALKSDTPSVGSFELTPLCNLDCKMCYVHLQDPSVKEKMLGKDQWIPMIQDAIDDGMFIALLTGGEALMHPDFWDIYMYLIDRGVSVQVKTNGILLNEENIQRFTEYPPFRIDTSLYGCDSESYVAVTGVDAFERVTGNIRAAIDAGLNIRLMITPSSFLAPWIEQTMKVARSFGISVVVNGILDEPNPNTGRHREDFELSSEEYNRIMAMKEEIFLPDYDLEDEVEFNLNDRPDVAEKGLHCGGGRIMFALNWDGMMVPCLSFPRTVICVNALEKGFRQAWNEVNQAIKNYEVPKKCHSCEYNTRCHYCPVVHQKTADQHLCDEALCAWTIERIEMLDKRQNTENQGE